MIKISGDAIRHNLATHTIGQNVIYVDQTGSTNTELKKLARTGAPEGFLYIADEQLVGRGRLSRGWTAPAGSSLLFSLLFRPGQTLTPIQLQRLTMLCALALADAIEQETVLKPQLKWPNDLLYDGKKLAGILTEAEFEEDRVIWAIVGIGLNVSADFSRQTEPQPGSGDPPLAHTATSLSMILSQETGALRLPILRRFLENVEQRYEALKEGRSPHKEWESRLIGLGRPVTVTTVSINERMHGTIAGVDKNGALQIKLKDGSIKTVLAGDVTLR